MHLSITTVLVLCASFGAGCRDNRVHSDCLSVGPINNSDSMAVIDFNSNLYIYQPSCEIQYIEFYQTKEQWEKSGALVRELGHPSDAIINIRWAGKIEEEDGKLRARAKTLTLRR